MRSRRPLSRIGRYLLAVAIVGSAMALGSIHTGVLCVVGVVVGAAAVLVWWGAERVLVRPAATAVLLTGLGLTFYTLLQAVPLPASFVGVIAPHTADIWARCLSPLHEPGPSWVSISLDPIATRIEVLRGVIYVAAFLAALKITSRRDGSGFLATAIIAGGVIMAIAAIVHPALGLTKVYGFYDPGSRIDPRHVAPLMNANHLATCLNTSFSIALAAAVAREPAVSRPFAISAVVVLVGTQLWVASRGGILVMIVAAVLVIWMSRARIANERTTITRAAPLLAVAIASLGMIVYGASPEAVTELASSDTSKLGFVREMGRMLPSYWMFGAGRGAFESTFPEFRHGATHHVFTHPETILIQWPSEWGIPVSLVAAGALLIALWPRKSVARSHAALGAWVALVVAALHNVVDFGLETPGVVIPLAVCAALVVGGAPDHAPRLRFERWSLAPRLPALGAAFATVGALALALPSVRHELIADREALRILAVTQGTPIDVMHETARLTMLRHPAEPYLPYAVAVRASREHDESLMPWIERVLERAKVYGPAHLLLGRFLTTASPAQARMEYRFALGQEPDLFNIVMREAPRLVGGFDDAMELVAGDAFDVRVLEALVPAIEKRLPSTTVRLDAVLRLREANAKGPIERALQNAVWAIEAGDSAPWCVSPPERAECLVLARKLAKELQTLTPTSCDGYALDARARVAANGDKTALDEMLVAAERVTDRTACLREVVALARLAQAPSVATSALDQIARAGCTTDAECASNLLFVANTERDLGNPRKALAMLKRAHARTPEDDELLADIALLASQVQMHAEAVLDYELLAKRHPENSRWATSAAVERDIMIRSATKL